MQYDVYSGHLHSSGFLVKYRTRLKAIMFTASSSAGTIITLNATTTGGAARGSFITLIPVAANVWSVNGVLIGSGSVATPFS